MTVPAAAHTLNSPVPSTNWRDRLDELAADDRLAAIRPGIAFRLEVAAIAKHFEGRRAVLCPKPSGRPVPARLAARRDLIG